MQLPLISCGILAFLSAHVSATALTYKLQANERSCFFTETKAKGEKVAFYFAVQSGGSFDVDYEVTGPGGKYILDGQKERQGDFVFTANEVGEYSFCFNNEMSTYTDKFVDFEISVSSTAQSGPRMHCARVDSLLTRNPLSRSRTRPASTSPRSRAHRPSKPRPSRSPSSRSPARCRPSRATKSTSEPARTATLVPSAAPSSASSTLPLSRLPSSSAWAHCRSLLFDSSSR